MKKHAIIPIFISHRGCPNDCVFCNQRKITARTDFVTPTDVRHRIEEYLPTLENRGLETLEIAFFGGSFTGIPIEEQSALLAIAKEYKDNDIIDKIHLSTRPDYIDEEILNNLKYYGVDVIELGIQSFDDDVLTASGRGHTSKQAIEGCRMVKEWGFELGIQLMIGLPNDTKEKAIRSAIEAVKLEPEMARLYPTVILEDTKLKELFLEGKYIPLEEEEAVEITADMYKILDEANINILRVGLKSTDIINNGEDSAIAGGNYHPAFRQLVEGKIAAEELERQLKNVLKNRDKGCRMNKITFYSNSASFSNMIGHCGKNKKYFSGKYENIIIDYKIDQTIAKGRYIVL